MLLEVKNFILDLFFPVTCTNCGKEGEWLCKECEGKINFINSSFCAKCNRLTEEGKLCDSCRRNSKLGGILIVGYYNDEILKKIIWEFKYNFVEEIGSYLAKLMIQQLGDKINKESSIFAAVPLDKKRLRWRGFNQSEILAREAAKSLNIDFLKDTLKRVKKTESQIGLTRKQREENVRGAFTVNRVVKDKRIYLVDDVMTTGSTLEECAKELRVAGAREIWGVVLAKD